MNVIDIARVCHEANRAVQQIQQNPGIAVSLPWDQLDAHTAASIISGVEGVLAGKTPEQSHAGFCAIKIADGWVFGPVKDADAKTHPDLVPYDQLPDDQKQKNVLFNAIVNALKKAPSDVSEFLPAESGAAFSRPPTADLPDYLPGPDDLTEQEAVAVVLGADPDMVRIVEELGLRSADWTENLAREDIYSSTTDGTTNPVLAELAGFVVESADEHGRVVDAATAEDAVKYVHAITVLEAFRS